MITLGSLFDGAGTAPFAARQYGVKTLWTSEIEPFPLRVGEKHFPEAVQLGDVSSIDGAKIKPVDIIVFGSPCQDLSVAGKRAGLEGERSGLFMQAVRIIKEMREATNGKYPEMCIWENVPGSFSSNKGEDFRIVLEELCKIKACDTSIPRPEKRRGGLMDGAMQDSSWETTFQSLGECSMNDTGAHPRDADESTLYSILEAGVPEKYYLSPTACQGILRRAENRGKELPALLRVALTLQSGGDLSSFLSRTTLPIQE